MILFEYRSTGLDRFVPAGTLSAGEPKFPESRPDPAPTASIAGTVFNQGGGERKC